MSENSSIPHVRLPRSLLRDPLWIDSPLSYQNVFTVLVEKVCFKPQRFDDHGIMIDLLPGQICISERELLKFCNKYVTRNDVQRAIKKYILYGFLSQEVRHKKSIITITHKDTYELIKRCSDPRSEPNLSQTRAKLEPEKKKEEKEKKEEYIISREAQTADKLPEKKSSFLIESEYAYSKKVVGLDFGKENFESTLSNENETVVAYKDEQSNITNINRRNNSLEIKTKSNKKRSNETKSKQKTSKAKVKSEEYRQSLVERRFNIHISEQEHSSLIEKFGKELTEKSYDELSRWKKSKIDAGNEKEVEAHTDFYRLTTWVIKRVQEKISKINIPANSIEENKKYAQQVADSFISAYYKIEVLSTKIEFTPQSGQSVPDVINYSENGFREQVENVLRKRQFREKTRNIY